MCNCWMPHIKDGPVFRSLSKHGTVQNGKALSGYAVGLVVKRAVEALGWTRPRSAATAYGLGL